MKYILIEVADRDINSLEFNTQEEARAAMYETVHETMLMDEGETEGEEMYQRMMHDLSEYNNYSDDACEVFPDTGWYNRNHGSQLDWKIVEVDTSKDCEETAKKYNSTLTAVFEMKQKMAESEYVFTDYENYQNGYHEGYIAGMKEAVRTVKASTFLYEKD